jgi:hypothetical protein
MGKNMEELQRYGLHLDGDRVGLLLHSEGEWSRFADAQARIEELEEQRGFMKEREARLKARIEELERDVAATSDHADYWEAKDARWRERIEALAEIFESPPSQTGLNTTNAGDVARALRSLLDSGEESPVQTSGGESASSNGPAPSVSASYRTPPDGVRHSPPVAPSPALEGREEPLGRCVEHGTWPLSEPHGQCPQCGDKLVPVKPESGPDSVAVPEKVEVNREEAVQLMNLMLTTSLGSPGLKEIYNKFNAAFPLAAFRATDTGGTD